MSKILMVTTVPSTLTAFLLPHAAYLKEKGWQVDAAAREIRKNERCKLAFDRCFDISWERNPLKMSNFTKALRQIRSIVRQQRYDIVHVHTPVASLVTRFALRHLRKELGCKVIYTAHGFHFYKGGNPLKNYLFRNLEKLASRWTDYLIVINQEDYEAALEFFPKEILSLIPGIGLNLGFYSPKAVPELDVEEVRKSLKLNRANILFLMIAEFNKGKRHVDVLKALSMVKNPYIHVAFAGIGPNAQRIRSICHTLSLTDRVHFLGYQKDVRPWILSAAALIMPSEREGLSRSVLEALALGIPVIGSTARGVGDLLSYPGALLFPVGDVKKLAELIDSFNPQLPKPLVDMANYDERKIANEVFKVYGNFSL